MDTHVLLSILGNKKSASKQFPAYLLFVSRNIVFWWRLLKSWELAVIDTAMKLLIQHTKVLIRSSQHPSFTLWSNSHMPPLVFWVLACQRLKFLIIQTNLTKYNDCEVVVQLTLCYKTIHPIQTSNLPSILSNFYPLFHESMQPSTYPLNHPFTGNADQIGQQS